MPDRCEHREERAGLGQAQQQELSLGQDRDGQELELPQRSRPAWPMIPRRRRRTSAGTAGLFGLGRGSLGWPPAARSWLPPGGPAGRSGRQWPRTGGFHAAAIRSLRARTPARPVSSPLRLRSLGGFGQSLEPIGVHQPAARWAAEEARCDLAAAARRTYCRRERQDRCRFIRHRRAPPGYGRRRIPR